MAAYAALNSVMFILQQIQQHPRPPITIPKGKMESLCENVSFLQDFLENYSHREVGDGHEVLESRIADAAYAAEDIIGSHIAHKILAKSKFHDETSCTYLFCRGVKKMIRKSLFCQDLKKVIEDMNLIKKGVIEIQVKTRGTNDDQLPTNIISTSANVIGSSTVPPPTRRHYTNTMVGFDDVLIQVMDSLIGYPTNRQVLSIVGMGGIGKTTLARNVYDNPTIAEHFDILIWVTISQKNKLRDILLETLSCLQNDENKSSEDNENKSSEDELGVQLHKGLCGRRYLIVLDDVWSIEPLEKLMLFFPDNNNGSRIMITSRMLNVGNSFGSFVFKMNRLDEDKSWDLFCKIVFPQEQCCPPKLEEIGKKIARKCEGLPLAIVVIGGLAKLGKTQKHWEHIIETFEEESNYLKPLSLIYNQLPTHLKPCFLYMGVFPIDTEVTVSSLIRLWVAEGFLKPIAAKSMEEVAEEYLKDLIDMNLIFVSQWGPTGKMKYCKMHDLSRDLCLYEGQKYNFLWVRRVHDLDNLEGIQSQRQISILEGALEEQPDINMVSKYAYMDGRGNYRYCQKELVNLRYLEFETKRKSTSIFPSSIHLLWNLQTLIIKGVLKGANIDVPPEIWEMSQLRHVEIDNWFSLPVPLIHEGDDDNFILRNLHTLKRIRNLKLSVEVIKSIPNIKKLRISYRVIRDKEWWHNYGLNNLHLLNKLESLYIDWLCYPEPNFHIEFVRKFAFPSSLKKLTLYCTNLVWEDMRMIGSLPHLQILKLKAMSFCGPKWNPVEGEFLSLEFLLIEWCKDLEYWNVNRTHFPCLEKLVLRCLHKLKEIPLDIGQIPTLRYIELWNCKDSAVMSAKNVWDEQVELGNEDLEVRVNGKRPF